MAMILTETFVGKNAKNSLDLVQDLDPMRKMISMMKIENYSKKIWVLISPRNVKEFVWSLVPILLESLMVKIKSRYVETIETMIKSSLYMILTWTSSKDSRKDASERNIHSNFTVLSFSKLKWSILSQISWD